MVGDGGAGEEQRPTRSRRGRPTLARLATLAVFGLAGLLLVASAVTANGTDLRAARAGDLRGLVAQRSVVVAELQGAVDASAQRVAEQSAAGGDTDAPSAARAAALSPAAGLTAVVGPGLIVTLDDAPRPTGGRTPPGNPAADDLVVHQQDVEAVVNAMWRAGASGVSVMGRRLIATSAVRCVGNTLLLDGRVYSPPYEIAAVGDQARIERELQRDPQLVIYQQYVDLYGLGYRVRHEDQLRLPAHAGPLPLVGGTR